MKKDIFSGIAACIVVAALSCTQNGGTEKHQGSRNNIVNVREKIKEIQMGDVLVSSSNSLYLICDYLIIQDSKSPDKILHLFDKNQFDHVVSTGIKGEGPGEITIIGHIGIDELNRRFYLTDFGKYKIFSYDLDSVLVNPSYMPTVKMTLNEKKFPAKYHYINDTLSMGVMIEPVGNSSFNQSVARWNMQTGEIVPMKYEHPEIEKKRIALAVSMENGIYVECYHHHDLMTICSLDGELKYNIYGAKWDNRKTNRFKYYGDVTWCNNRILVSFSDGKDNFSDEWWPTKFLVFDMNGDYLRTLETGYRLSDFCYDKENNRIIMSMDDEIQFAYLELDGLLD